MAVSHVKSVTIADSTNTDIVRPSDWNSGHNEYRTLSGNTAGVSTVSGPNVIFSGGPNVTLSGNGNTLVFSAGGGGAVLRAWENVVNGATFGAAMGGTISNVIPLQIPGVLSAGYVRLFASMNNAVNVTQATSVNTTISFLRQQTFSLGLYSRGLGTASASYFSVATLSALFNLQASVVAAGVGSNYSSTVWATYPGSNGSNTFTSSAAVSSSNFSISTSVFPAFTGARALDFLVPAMLSGDCALVIGSSGATAGTSQMIGNLGAVNLLSGVSSSQAFSQLAGAAIEPHVLPGAYTNAASATTSAFAISDLQTTASNFVPAVILFAS